MKILHIITDLSTGGAEVMLNKILSMTDRKRFEPAVISLKGKGTLGGPIEALGIPVHALGMEKTLIKGLNGIFQLRNRVRSLEPELIQGWMPHGNFMAIVATSFLKKKVPVVWNIRQAVYDLSYESRNTAYLIRGCARLSSRPARILYNSQTAARQHEALGYKARKTLIIPNGFDTEKFRPSPEARTALRESLGLTPDAFLIGLVARFHPMKDHETFVKAAAQLSQSGHSVHFVLSGKGVDTENSQLMQWIRSHRLESQFHLLGDRKDVSTLTAGLDIAATSSYTESFPNVIGEAMACGIPCAVTDVGDSAQVVGDTGKVVPPRDPLALAEAWRQLIELPTEERLELGRKARARIQKCYNLDTIVHKYEDLYKELLDNQTTS